MTSQYNYFLIVLHFEILIINLFGMHTSLIILQVLTIMEVPLPRLQIGPYLKFKGLSESKEKHHKQEKEVRRPTFLSFKFPKVVSQVTHLYSSIIYIAFH